MLTRRQILQSITAAALCDDTSPPMLPATRVTARTRALIFDLPADMPAEDAWDISKTINAMRDRGDLGDVEIIITCGGIRTTAVEG